MHYFSPFPGHHSYPNMSLHHWFVRGLDLLYFDCFQGATSTYIEVSNYKEIKKGNV